MISGTSTLSTVVEALVEVLGLESPRAESITESTPLFGRMPEFDSLAIVELITMLEDRFGFEMDEADITGEVFETVGSLASYVDGHRS